MNEWAEFARQLSCPQGDHSCSNGMFTGPVWGHVNMFPTTMNWFLGWVLGLGRRLRVSPYATSQDASMLARQQLHVCILHNHVKRGRHTNHSDAAACPVMASIQPQSPNLLCACCSWAFRSGGTSRWVELTSVHWYKATAETYNTAATLLDEEPIRREMANLRELVRVSNRWV